jgi:hypothetical protein
MVEPRNPADLSQAPWSAPTFAPPPPPPPPILPGPANVYPGNGAQDFSRISPEMLRTHMAFETSMRPCDVCGQQPAIAVEFIQNIGLIMARQKKEWKGTACRDCGLSLGRKFMNLTLVTGWTGMISFFVNWGCIFENARSLMSLSKLPASAVQSPKTLHPGRPVVQRPGLWVLFAVVGALVFNANHRSTVGSSSTWRVGSCIQVRGQDVRPVRCIAPHDAIVIGVATVTEPCPGSSVTIGKTEYCIAMQTD